MEIKDLWQQIDLLGLQPSKIKSQMAKLQEEKMKSDALQKKSLEMLKDEWEEWEGGGRPPILPLFPVLALPGPTWLRCQINRLNKTDPKEPYRKVNK
jgi:hypothetical protein